MNDIVKHIDKHKNVHQHNYINVHSDRIVCVECHLIKMCFKFSFER